MPLYSYTAIDASTGLEKTGALEDASPARVADVLKSRGLYPVRLVAAESGGGLKRLHLLCARGGFNLTELALFTRRLAALVNAGLPLVRGLDLLAKQEAGGTRRAVIVSLADGIRAGGALSAGMAKHRKVFDRLYLGMVRAGEAGGVLGAVLEQIAQHLEKTARARGRLKMAMTYPSVVLAASAGIVAALMMFVVPKFENIFAGLLKGAPLPALTQAVLGLGRNLQERWLESLGSLVLVGAGLAWLRRTWAGDRLLLKLPVVGGLCLKAGMARFCRSLGTLLTSGVPILQALLLTRDTTGNRVIAGAIDAVHRRVREGEGLACPLSKSGVFPPVVTGMIEVGEETGALPAMLVRVADIYDDEVERAAAALTSLIEPATIVLMAAIVGAIVLALFLPVVRIIEAMM